MDVTFLGTGAAFSPHAYNVAMLVDRQLLLDAGAPLHVHLPRVGSGVEQVRGALISHFHLDHTVGLAFLLASRALDHPGAPGVAIAGPPGIGDYVREMLHFAWGKNVLTLVEQQVKPSFHEVADGVAFEVCGYRCVAHLVEHVGQPAFGFIVERNGCRLGYSGDASLCDGLERLIGASDHFVVEMTSESPTPWHLSRPEVEDLLRRYPGVKFIITHRSDLSIVPGATNASDFLTVRL